MKKTDLQPVKGARDFIPNDFLKRQWLFEQMIESAKEFGFEQYDSPVLESLETYKTKSSSELVDEQSYRFTDRGGREVTLRPEMTPVLARMVSANQDHLAFPVKWFSIPVLWRYEKPQSGRLREHFQWNVDIIGPSQYPELQDTDILAVLCRFLQKIGLGPDKIKIHINDKKILQDFISQFLDLPPDKQSPILKSIDKLPKIGPENTIRDLKITYPKLDTQKIQEFITQLNSPIESTSGNISMILEKLSILGFDRYLKIDRKIVRGLDYYTSTVFEVFPTDLNSRAVAGGGRYDNLIGQFSNRTLPGVGFGMGDVVINNLLEKFDLYPSKLRGNKRLLVAALSENAIEKSLEISHKLRQSNSKLNTSFFPNVIQMRDVLTYANTSHFNFLLVIGDKELAEKTYTLKDLDRNHQTTDRKIEILKQIKRLSR